LKTIVRLQDDHVVVKQAEKKTESGIIIPDIASKGGTAEMFEGTVLAVGDSVDNFKPGDYVTFGRSTMSIRTYNGKEYIYLREDAIYSVIAKVDEDYTPTQNEFVI
jgi:co-chaperonin GroES (HSP10)